MTESIAKAVTAAETTDPLTLRLQRKFTVPPTQIYQCFTEAEHLAQWFGPKEVVCRNVVVDATVGGSYQLEMINPDGSTIVLLGEFLELEFPSRIQMTWRWQREGETAPGEKTRVTIRLAPMGNGTLLELTHERFAETTERDRHGSGWSSTFDCLDDLLERRENER